MIFGYTADLHLSRYGQEKIETETNISEKLFGIRKTLYNMVEHLMKNNIDTLVIGGDILHNKSIIYNVAQNVMLNFFRDFPTIKFIVIDGNHDLSAKGSDAVSALISIDNEPNVQRIVGTHYKDKENDILYVPYSHNMVNIIKNNSAKYLISHFGLNEGVLSSGLSITADIKLSDLVGKYEIVLLGHYHKPQEIVNENINLYYVGSPVQLDRGEKNEEKRFLIIDSNKKSIESIPTVGYKKYIEYKINEENKIDIVKLAIEEKKKGNYISIVTNGDLVIEEDIQNSFNIINTKEKDITNRGISSTMSEEERLTKFAELKEIPKNDIPIYVKIAKEIIFECTDLL